VFGSSIAFSHACREKVNRKMTGSTETSATPDGGGGHASGGGKRGHADEKRQTSAKPSPRCGPMKAER
jgi:hypothetical protein